MLYILYTICLKVAACNMVDTKGYLDICKGFLFTISTVNTVLELLNKQLLKPYSWQGATINV